MVVGLIPIAAKAIDVNDLVEASSLISNEVRDESAISKLNTLGGDINEVKKYVEWLKIGTIDPLRQNTLSALSGIWEYSKKSYGELSPETLYLEINLLLEKSRVEGVEKELDSVVEKSGTSAVKYKTRLAKSVNLLARMKRFELYHFSNIDFFPETYIELFDLQKEALDLFSPTSTEISWDKIEVYSALANIVSFPAEHIQDQEIAFRLAGMDGVIEKKKDTTSYLVGSNGEYWDNSLWYMEKVEEMYKSIYSESDIRTIAAKYNRLSATINIIGSDADTKSELLSSISSLESYFPMSSPTYCFVRLSHWINDIIWGDEPSGFGFIDVLADNLKSNYGEKSEYYVQACSQIALLKLLMYPNSTRVFEDFSALCDSTFGKYSAKSLSLQFSVYRFIYVADETKYFKSIESIREKYIENRMNGEDWLEFGTTLAMFYRNNAHHDDKAFEIAQTVADIAGAIRGKNSPYHCNRLLNTAIFASSYYANTEDAESKKAVMGYFDKFFKAIEHTDVRVKADLKKAGIYHAAHYLLFLENDYEGALKYMENNSVANDSKEKNDILDDEIKSMKAYALISLGKNSSDTNRDVDNIVANEASKEAYMRNLEIILNCGQYYFMADRPEDVQKVVQLGLETNESIGGGFSEVYMNLRLLLVEAFAMQKDYNNVRRTVSEDFVNLDNVNYVENSGELLNYLWTAYNMEKTDGVNAVKRMPYLLRIQQIAQSMIETTGQKEVFLMNHIFPAITEMLMEWSNTELPDQKELVGLMIDQEEYEAVEQFIAKTPKLLSDINTTGETFLNLLPEMDSDKYLPAIVSYLNAYATFHENLMHDSSKAESLHLRAFNLAESTGNQGLMSVAASYLYPFYFRSGDKAKGFRYLKIFESAMKADDSPDPNIMHRVNMDYQFMDYYLEAGDYAQASLYSRDAYNCIKEYINGTYRLMTTDDQDNFMNHIGDPAFPLISLLEYIPETMASETYDAILYRTGLQLRSQQTTRKAIIQGPDEIVALDKKLQILRDKLARLKTNYRYDENIGSNQPDNKEFMKLGREINRLEQQLIDKTSDVRTDIVANISWESVRDALKDREIAVEYVYSRSKLMALIVRPGVSSPTAVSLCNSTELVESLEKLTDKDNVEKTVESLYGDSKSPLYSLLWQPLENKLEGAECIYISAPGILSVLSFDAIVKPDGARLFDDYELYRLTTTAQLLEKKDMAIPQNALIVGNVYYSDAQREMYTSVSPAVKTDISVKRGAIQEQFEYLEHAAQEASEVYETLSGVKSLMLKGAEANELQLRNSLDQTSPGILHIATHGYFIADEEEAYAIPFMTKYRRKIGSSMFRAGLALDNAEAAWQGEEMPSDSDGILTADEISQLNLQGTKLVTLSACRTALGDYSFDGVYGLQRGLKIAGAKSMMLSLWNVDDIATSKFMADFYKKWIVYNDRRRAYRESIKEIRKSYPEAYYWAAFVMID